MNDANTFWVRAAVGAVVVTCLLACVAVWLVLVAAILAAWSLVS